MLKADRWRGKFLVFDGIDGSGKGEQIRLLADVLTRAGLEVVLARDPGGTPIGDRIRHVLFDYDLSAMDVRCEAFLFMASRAQLLHDVVDPALAAGRTVLCDRFVSATCAYQGAAGYDPRRVIQLAPFAIDRTWPHLTLLLDLPVEEGLGRIGRKADARRRTGDAAGQVRLFSDTHTDAMEARPLEFHRRVREMFLQLPGYYPAPVAIVDAAAPVEVVHERVMEALERAVL
jgi:dTMP kinase